MTVFSWACSSPSAICDAMRSASSSGRPVGALMQQLGERLALDQLHHQKMPPLVFFQVVNRRDVRMIQRG